MLCLSTIADVQCGKLQVLQQLDGEGKSRVGAVLRNLPQKTVLVVGQADSYLTQVFDNVDVVVKRKGCATLEAR